MSLLPLPTISSIGAAYECDEIYDFINSGTFASVFRAVKRSVASSHNAPLSGGLMPPNLALSSAPVTAGSVVALKVIQKSGIKNSRDTVAIVNEIAVLRSVHHPRIVRLLDAFQTPREVVLVLAFVDGQELLQGLGGSRSVPETRVKDIMRQLVDAVRYLHTERHVVHRDLKPENILINPQGGVTIVDFGLSKNIGRPRLVPRCSAPRPGVGPSTDFFRASSLASDESNPPSEGGQRILRSSSVESVDSVTSHLDSPITATPCGSLKFAAPETVRTLAEQAAHWNTTRRILPKVDMYSLGIIAFVLLCGQLPYDTRNKQTLAAQMERGPQFEGPKWNLVTSDARDWVKGLLAADPEKRLSAQEALNHVWMTPPRHDNEEEDTAGWMTGSASTPPPEASDGADTHVAHADQRAQLSNAFQALLPPIADEGAAPTESSVIHSSPGGYFAA